MCDSMTSVSGAAPSGGVPNTSEASPSVSTRSGAKVMAGQPGAEGGRGPKGAGHHLAVAAEHLGTGDGAVLGPADAGAVGVIGGWCHVAPFPSEARTVAVW